MTFGFTSQISYRIKLPTTSHIQDNRERKGRVGRGRKGRGRQRPCSRCLRLWNFPPKYVESISKIYKGFYLKSLHLLNGRHGFCVHIPGFNWIKRELFAGHVNGVYTLAAMSTVSMWGHLQVSKCKLGPLDHYEGIFVKVGGYNTFLFKSESV